jgi:hypothetical protein
MAPSALPTPDSSPGEPVSPLSLATKYEDTLLFYINGTRVVLDDPDPEITLLEYLRQTGLTGTKLYVSLTIGRNFLPAP